MKLFSVIQPEICVTDFQPIESKFIRSQIIHHLCSIGLLVINVINKTHGVIEYCLMGEASLCQCSDQIDSCS